MIGQNRASSLIYHPREYLNFNSYAPTSLDTRGPPSLVNRLGILGPETVVIFLRIRDLSATGKLNLIHTAMIKHIVFAIWMPVFC